LSHSRIQITISDLVGELKGASSHDLNKVHRMKRLQWQRGFGMASYGRKQLPWVQRYIANQKQHHAERTTELRLEKSRSMTMAGDYVVEAQEKPAEERIFGLRIHQLKLVADKATKAAMRTANGSPGAVPLVSHRLQAVETPPLRASNCDWVRQNFRDSGRWDLNVPISLYKLMYSIRENAQRMKCGDSNSGPSLAL
jgi:hypothetical protein